MTCPVCGGKTKVIDSRQPDEETVIRRRECLGCCYRFSTEECEIDYKPKKRGRKNEPDWVDDS